MHSFVFQENVYQKKFHDRSRWNEVIQKKIEMAWMDSRMLGASWLKTGETVKSCLEAGQNEDGRREDEENEAYHAGLTLEEAAH